MNITGPVMGLAGAILALGVAERFLPVVALMEAVEITEAGDVVTAHVTGYKILDCSFVAGSGIAWASTDTGWRELGPVVFVDDTTPDSTRPASAQKQDFGYWQWQGVPEGSPRVKATVLNNCNGRVRVTTVGPFEVRE